MVNFTFPTFRVTPVEEKIMDKLTVIESHFVPPAHFDMFKRRIEILTKGGGADRAQTIVSQVAKNIKKRGPVLIDDLSTHSRRELQVQILRDAMVILDEIQGGTRNQAEEEAAIQQDAADFQRQASRLVQNFQQPNHALVYDMANPSSAPIRIPVYSNCRQVRRYLQSHDLAYSPELWAKTEGRQKRTPRGLSWEWLPPNGDVQGRFLEFVDRKSLGDYIVVLKLLRGQDPAEIPEPLEIAPVGQPCCDSNCRNLQAHLRSIWPNHRVARALRIDDGDDVLSETFDNNLFVPRTNNLCVHLEVLEEVLEEVLATSSSL